MQRSWLTIIGYFLAVLVFFVAAGYAVLYATGYKIDWKTLSLKKTGFILIETYPKGAAIKLAGKPIDKTTPATIKRLLPGTYHIDLNKEGYRSWTGNILVESGLVTEKRNVLLTSQDLSPGVLWEHPVNKLIPNADNTKLALLSNNEIWLWDIKNKKEALILNAALLRQQIKDRNATDIARGILMPINFAPDNKTLLVQSRGASNYYWLLVDSDNGQIQWLISGRNISNWKWLNNTELAFLQNNKLSFVTTTSAKIKELASGVLDYGLIEGNVYAIIKNKDGKIMLAKIDRGGFIPPEEIAGVSRATNYYLGKIKSAWLVIATANNFSTVLLSEKLEGKLTWKTLADRVAGNVLWDDTYLIYKQNSKLIVTQWEELDKIQTMASPFNGALLHFSFDTILYWNDQKLRSIDLTGENDYELLPLVAAGEFVITEPQISKLIFIDAKTRYLSEVALR